MYLELVLSNIPSAFIVGLIIGIVVAFIQNNPYIIRILKKAEDKQKLEIKYIEEIINETRGLKKTIIQLKEEMSSLEDKLGGGEASGNDVDLVKETTQKKLENFIFLVDRNIRIGSKDQKLENEVANLENICKEMFSLFELGKPDLHAIISGDIENIESVDWVERYHNMVFNFNRMNAPEKINDCIEIILDRCEAKIK